MPFFFMTLLLTFSSTMYGSLEMLPNDILHTHLCQYMHAQDTLNLCSTARRIYFNHFNTYAHAYYTLASSCPRTCRSGMNSITVNGTTSHRLFLPHTVSANLTDGTIQNFRNLILAKLTPEQIAHVLAAAQNQHLEGVLIRDVQQAQEFRLTALSLPATVTNFAIENTPVATDDALSFMQNNKNKIKHIAFLKNSVDVNSNERVHNNAFIQDITIALPNHALVIDLEAPYVDPSSPSYKYLNNQHEFTKLF